MSAVPDVDQLLEMLDRLAHADLAADLAAELRPEEIVERTLHRVVGLVPGAQEAGLGPRLPDAPAVTTGPLAAACLALDDPERAPGVGSVLQCELPHAAGRLVICAREADVFGVAARQVMPNIANRVCVAVAHAQKLHHLRRAIEAHRIVGQACGILMERHRLRPEQAFDALRAASQRNHLKMRDLAERVVETGLEPGEIRW